MESIKKTEEHVVKNLDDILKEKDLIVLKDIHNLPTTKDSYISPNLVIAINLSGTANVEYDMQKVVFKKNDVAVMLPNHILSNGTTTDDYNVVLIVASGEFANELSQRASMHDHLKYHSNPACHLSDIQIRKLMDVVNVMKTISDYNHPNRMEDLCNAIDIFFVMLSEFRKDIDSKHEVLNNGEQIFSRFYNLLTKHYLESREVIFYADKLFLTPKYFSTVIRQYTGKTAAHWIANYVILQAKSMIRNHLDMTMQGISIALGFNDQASFTRYFKRETGYTPSEYRRLEIQRRG